MYWVKNLKECVVFAWPEVVLLVTMLCVFLGKRCPWLSVDTALYILKKNENPAEPQLMCFTELRNREVHIFF